MILYELYQFAKKKKIVRQKCDGSFFEEITEKKNTPIVYAFRKPQMSQGV